MCTSILIRQVGFLNLTIFLNYRSKKFFRKTNIGLKNGGKNNAFFDYSGNGILLLMGHLYGYGIPCGLFHGEPNYYYAG